MKRILTFLTLYILHYTAYTQQPSTTNSADIYLQLQKLNVLGSVLYIAAHPDDENTRLLAFLSKEKLYRTGYLSLTRGDGGQNLIGNEQGIELGLIRTQELLSARRIDGAEQFFSRAYDFGYSKSVGETMRIWDKEKILSDMVWVIRRFQPDVIITRFPGDERAGHGHHAASSLLANEAFAAAADPTKFTEQFKYGVQPWQAKRILWNTFNFGSTNTTGEDQFKIDVGTYNPLLGKGYGEIAAESRSQHKSQGFGVPRQRGISIEYFKTTGGSAPQNTLLDSVAADWSRVDGGAAIKAFVDKIIATYSFKNPEKSVADLVLLYQQLKKLKESYWQRIKLKETQLLIEVCSGLYAEATTPQQQAVPGDSLSVTVLLNKRNNISISLQKITITSSEETGNATLASSETYKVLPTNDNVNLPLTFRVNTDAKPSQPYWLQNTMLPGSFDVINQMLVGKAESSPVFAAKILVEIMGQLFEMERGIQNKYTDPVKGELFQPIVIMPRLSVQQEPALIVVSGENAHRIKLHYTANTPTGNVQINVHQQPLMTDTLPMAKGNERFVEKSIGSFHQPIAKNNVTESGITKDTFTLAGNVPALYPITIRYDHIPNITYFKPAVQSILNLDVKIAGKNIGYITGAGDKVPQALEQMGYVVTRLGENDIYAANLQQFDAVITGVRAYNVNAFLTNKYNELMAYVQSGGNLIVQYNTNNGTLPRIGPYPFSISRVRITDETANVQVELPNHSLFNFPNKITSKDFEGWIQERSIYQAEQLDSNYAAPISMADAGEKPSNGSLILCKYGKGNFVYTGLVFFRELPAGVAGAYRLMANLLALPRR